MINGFSCDMCRCKQAAYSLVAESARGSNAAWIKRADAVQFVCWTIGKELEQKQDEARLLVRCLRQ